MARRNAAMKRGQALLEYQRRLAQSQNDAAMAKAVAIASNAEVLVPVCQVGTSEIAATDALVCGATTRLGDVLLTCKVEGDHDVHMAEYGEHFGGHFTWR